MSFVISLILFPCKSGSSGKKTGREVRMFRSDSGLIVNQLRDVGLSPTMSFMLPVCKTRWKTSHA